METVGPIAEANVNYILDEVEERIERLLPMVNKDRSLCVMVFDPINVFEGGRTDEEREIIRLTAGRPHAMEMPVTTVAGVLQKVGQAIPSVLRIAKDLPSKRREGKIPIVVYVGSVIGVAYATLGQQSDDGKLSLLRDEVRESEEGVELSLSGALKVCFNRDEDDFEPLGRDLHRRFRARAQTAFAAEAIRTTPREPGETLISAFGGERLRRAFRRGGAAFFEYLRSELAEKSAN